MSRRPLLRIISIVIVALFAAGAVSVGNEAPRPNIVVILADDMGFSDIGCYGSEIETPNIDRLAAEGLRFTQFYNNARCCPTRAALLTGLYPHQAGIGHMIDLHSAGVRAKLNSPAYGTKLNDRCVTIGEALGEGGYQTFMSGKWHVGTQREAWPDRRGFSRTFALIKGAMNYYGRGPQLGKNEQTPEICFDGASYELPQDFFSTDAFSNHAAKFIRERDPDRPFFLYLAYNAPHWPLHAPPEDIAKYRGKYRKGFDVIRERRLAKQRRELGVDWALSPRDPSARDWAKMDAATRDDRDLRMAVYAAQIDRMDRGIGRVLDALREAGIERNTLVLFLADNGACAEAINRSERGTEIGTRESYTSYFLAWANVSNTPFRSFKHWTHEGGIATPLVARWPEGITKPGITHEPGHIIDILPTCLDLAGVPYPTKYKGRDITPVAGVSLAPVLRAGRLEPRELFWEHEGNRAVREGDWKLVSRHLGEWELFDMAKDRSELNDLASREPDRVRAMAAKYEAWAERCGVKPWPEGRKKE